MKTICFKMDEELFCDLKLRVAESGQSLQEYMNRMILQDLTTAEERLDQVQTTRMEIEQLRGIVDLVDDRLSEIAERLTEGEEEQTEQEQPTPQMLL